MVPLQVERMQRDAICTSYGVGGVHEAIIEEHFSMVLGHLLSPPSRTAQAIRAPSLKTIGWVGGVDFRGKSLSAA